jgi:hypothetical protein
MTITKATALAEFGSGIGTDGSILKVDQDNLRIGIGTTNPQATLQVGAAITMYGSTGIISATSYRGENVARGGGNDLVFYENDQEVTADYTITTSKNAMSAGPVGIATGITVTIPSGSTWTIV